MKIDVESWYLVNTEVGDLIVEVIDRRSGIDSWWSCRIWNKPKHNIIRVRRNRFKENLGLSLNEALNKSPQYFI